MAVSTSARGIRRSSAPGRALVAVASGLLLCIGCSKPATTVSGLVTIDGKPVVKAIVQFIPEKRDAASAIAISGPDGRYNAVVAPVPYVVTIAAQKVVGQRKDDLDPNGGMVDVYEDIVPARYRDASKTPLKVSPTKDRRTTADFPLSSGLK